MNKIASPRELNSELRTLLAYVEGSEQPSRARIAFELSELAQRMGVTLYNNDGEMLTFKAKEALIGHRGSVVYDISRLSKRSFSLTRFATVFKEDVEQQP